MVACLVPRRRVKALVACRPGQGQREVGGRDQTVTRMDSCALPLTATRPSLLVSSKGIPTARSAAFF